MPTARDSYEALQRKCARLQTQKDEMRADLGRSREENSNLRDASFLWLDLYERQLQRANDLQARLERAERRSVVGGR